MEYDTIQYEIIYRKQPASGIRDWIVGAEDFAHAAKPGQLMHVLVPDKTLRRPISICDIDVENGTLRLVFQERGEDTAVLGQKCLGDFVDLLAPPGNGFELGDTRHRTLFVGGGIGVPPLLMAARPFGQNATMILGFHNQESVILACDFALADCQVFVTTGDGGMDFRGTIVDCAHQYTAKTDVLFAYGPRSMLKALGVLAGERNIPAQLSLEERMVCDVGACLGCAYKILRDSKGVYGHVCKNGSVFNGRNIVWEEQRMADLKVTVAGVESQNLLIATPGTFDFGHEYLEFFPLPALGGISYKGTTFKERMGNPPPYIVEAPGDVLNMIGL